MGEVYETIIKVAAVLAGCGTIIGVVVKLFVLVRSILDKIDKMADHQNETYMAMLRLTIISEEMPLEERIAAGDKYLADGGNGAVKHKYEQLLGQLDRRNVS